MSRIPRLALPPWRVPERRANRIASSKNKTSPAKHTFGDQSLRIDIEAHEYGATPGRSQPRAGRWRRVGIVGGRGPVRRPIGARRLARVTPELPRHVARVAEPAEPCHGLDGIVGLAQQGAGLLVAGPADHLLGRGQARCVEQAVQVPQRSAGAGQPRRRRRLRPRDARPARRAADHAHRPDAIHAREGARSASARAAHARHKDARINSETVERSHERESSWP